MLGRLVDDVLQSASPDYPWGDTLPLLHGASWRMCNLECVIADRGKPAAGKVFQFRSSAKNIAVLQAARINAVSLANNHVLDYGEDALLQMLQLLDRAGIAHSGAGADLAQASRLATADVCGQKVGLLAFTDNEPAWEATASRPGVFYAPPDLGDRRAQNVLDIVRAQTKLCDLLIVSAHWGSNWGYLPESGHVEFAHALIEAGAGLVFGHSSHVFRGIEFYKGRPIIYGAGDFVDDYAVDPIERNDQGFIYLVETPGGIPRGLRLYPTLIRACRVCRAEGLQERGIVEKMKDLCAAFHTPARWHRAERYLEVGCSAQQETRPSQATA
ncbi:MAG: CapA family protein [Acidobacteriia bacterium]|nr:CapA family protein [Terriglobia bacterium]